MNFLTQVAGAQSALALYDIGKLEFSLYHQAVFGQLHAINTLADARKIRDNEAWQVSPSTFGAIPNPAVKWLSPVQR